MGELAKAGFSALKWNYVGLAARSICSIVVGVVLARILGPKPYGQLTAAALLIGLLNLLADGSFGSALVQAPTLSKRDIRAAFTFQLLCALLVSGAVLVVAPWVAVAFHDQDIAPVLRGLAPVFLLQALGQTSTGLLKRRLEFRQIQWANVGSYMFGYVVVGIGGACVGLGVWSLVLAQLAQSGVYSLWVYLYARHSVLPYWSRDTVRLFWFGAGMSINNVLHWATYNLDNAIVGRLYGSKSLGLYGRTYDLAKMPANSFLSSLQQVLFAGCSRAAHKPEALRRVFLASLAVTGLVVFPLCWGMAIAGRTIIVGLYGPAWAEVAGVFGPICFAVSLNTLMGVGGPLLAAVDNVHRELRAQSISLVVAVVSFWFAAKYSLEALAWAVVVVYGLRFYLVIRETLLALGSDWRSVGRSLRGAVVAGVLTAAAIGGVDLLQRGAGVGPVMALPLLVLSGGVALAAVLVLLRRVVLCGEVVQSILSSGVKLPAAVLRWLGRTEDQGALVAAVGD